MNYSDEHIDAVNEYKEHELIDEQIEDLERLAKQNNVTTDYYIQEFT